MRYKVIGLVLGLFIGHAHAQPFALSNALSALSTPWPAELPTTALSVSVRPLTSAATAQPSRWDHLPQRSRAPASVMKLVTAYAALAQLGPAFQWQTELLVNSVPKQGRLETPLYVRASGDPSLSVARLWQALAELRRQGISALDGGVVIDRERFGEVSIDPAAFDGAAERTYNASPDAFLVSWGVSELTLRFDENTGRWRAALDALPKGAVLENEIQALPGACQNLSAWARALEIQPPSNQSQVPTWVIRGKLPKACAQITHYRLLMPSASQSEAQFAQLWQQLGGTLQGGFQSGSVPLDARVWVRSLSEPLSDVLKPMLKYSNNVMARQVFLTLDAQPHAQPVTAAHAMRETLQARQVNLPELIIDNGSGLSRDERLSTDGLTQLLADAWREPWMPEFLAALPVWGVDGTLARLPKGAASQRARLKTGALDDVRALAGYVCNASGQWLAVAIIVNHPHAERALPFMHGLVETLAASQ